MKIVKVREGLFQVFSDKIREGMTLDKLSGMVYIVENKDEAYTCSCPAFRYRGGECKHVQICKEEPKPEEKRENSAKALNFIATHPEEMCEVIIELFGQELITKMLEQGDIFEYNHRNYRVLE